MIAFGSVDARICTKRIRSSGSSGGGGTPSPVEGSPSEPPAPDTEVPPPSPYPNPGPPTGLPAGSPDIVTYRHEPEGGTPISSPDAPANSQYNCPEKQDSVNCVKGQTKQKFQEYKIITRNGVEISREKLGYKYCCEFVPKEYYELTGVGTDGSGSSRFAYSEYNCPAKGPSVFCATTQTRKRYRRDKITEYYGLSPVRTFDAYWYCCTPDA